MVYARLWEARAMFVFEIASGSRGYWLLRSCGQRHGAMERFGGVRGIRARIAEASRIRPALRTSKRVQAAHQETRGGRFVAPPTAKGPELLELNSLYPKLRERPLHRPIDAQPQATAGVACFGLMF